MDEDQWQAIVNNDAAYNDKFFYGVKTTGIFCRPSCRSRIPKKENVLIFQSSGEALAAHFRPCKRCKPTGERLPEREWISIITNYIDHHYNEKLTLETLAAICHSSPYHLHRIFKKLTGVTPVVYIQQIRVNHAKEQLEKSNRPIAEIAAAAGISNVSYFITLFKKKTGQTPAEYRELKKFEH
jgi:AraC family transcriptional regulator of adaptative response / methylphosphotriester-DNA alkyltransferase methyltransferase